MAATAARRLTYSLPPRDDTLPEFAIPSLQSSFQRRGRSQPLLEQLPPSTPVPARSNFTFQESGRPSHPRHTLPVTSLALDVSTSVQDQEMASTSQHTPRGILYTGGRDGLLAAWELGLPLRKRRRQRAAAWDDELRDGAQRERDSDDIQCVAQHHVPGASGLASDLEDEVDESETPVEQHWQVDPSRRDEPLPQPRFRQCVQNHTDWINDILLCNSNQTVVSAGSDGTLQVWNPHDFRSSMTPQVLGSHRDYARALSHAREANWVASGGFDSVIKLWDIQETRPEPIIELAESAVKASVYALSANPAGSVISAGTPDKVVRAWDPRSGAEIASLIGHTDNVRSLVVSEDGRHLLSASSDSSIRLWSIGERRCLHTFTHHSESVWSLFSDHPNLDVFYSGDRSGLVCKVDWERCAEVAEGECVVLFKDAGTNRASSRGRASNGTNRTHVGIHKIIAQDNTYVWTAGGSSDVSIWKDVPSRMSREALYPIEGPATESSTGLLADFPAPAVSTPPASAQSGLSLRRPSALKHSSQGSAPSPNVSFAQRSRHDSPGPGLRFDAKSLPRQASGVSTRTHRSSHSNASLGSIEGAMKASNGAATGKEMTISATSTDSVHPAAMLFGIPFDSLVCLSPANDPYGASVGLGSLSVRDPDVYSSHSAFAARRSSAALPSGRPSLSYDSRQSPGPSAIPAHLHLPSRPLNRPKSTRSASIRFAPEAERLPRGSAAGLANDDMWEDDVVDEASDSDDEDAVEEAALEARQRYEDREFAVEAVPLLKKPESVIEGTHGLIRTSALNDRRHVLTIDTADVVALWDIVRGACLGTFRPDDILLAHQDGFSSDASDSSDYKHTQTASISRLPPAEALSLVKERIEGEETAPLWCNVDVRGGLLSVHLEEQRTFDAELYADEAVFLDPSVFREDQRVNVGKMVLRSLLKSFVETETSVRSTATPLVPEGVLAAERPEVMQAGPLRISIPRTQPHGHQGLAKRDFPHTPGMTIALAEPARSPAILATNSSPLTPTASRGGIAGLTSSFSALASASAQTPLATTLPGASSDYFSLANSSTAINTPAPAGESRTPTSSRPQTPASSSNQVSGGAGLMSRLKWGKSSKSERASAQDVKATTKVAGAGEESDTSANDDLSNLRQFFTKPLSIPPLNEVPVVIFPPDTTILIETSSSLGTWEIVYRGLVRTGSADVAALETSAPRWVLDAALHNKAPQQTLSKISFNLVPWVAPELRDNAGGETTIQTSANGSVLPTTLPELPSGNARLTATRMLRIKKTCAYVAEKLEMIASTDSRNNSIAGSRRASADAPASASNGGDETKKSTAGSSGAKRSLGSAIGLSGASTAASATSGKATSGSAGSSPPTSAQAAILATQNATSATATATEQDATELIEILCNDEVVPLHVTLAQVQRFWWKSGGDVELQYRHKAGGSL
ncbi:hypothetical protein IE81DRAFT_369128 [Ceraceosorus guamensis]|uniref:Uncharacterized protein n=1 Tax=Ceraceosorus guamensis TaxID=1522189 RepID=A0A316VPF0_9BASI|nr:hypothetical protein IE81DRAFT_369128 [Ceraceosorus guamensis]PWN39402.1 hypothetical protein IE81DRAFT_369128 [Ceraceosorus guamensis]